MVSDLQLAFSRGNFPLIEKILSRFPAVFDMKDLENSITRKRFSGLLQNVLKHTWQFVKLVYFERQCIEKTPEKNHCKLNGWSKGKPTKRLQFIRRVVFSTRTKHSIGQMSLWRFYPWTRNFWQKTENHCSYTDLAHKIRHWTDETVLNKKSCFKKRQ